MDNIVVKPLRLKLLGEITLYSGDDKMRLPPGKPAALLAYLWLNPGRLSSREHLCDLFWPHLEPEAARANLRTALHTLKKIPSLSCLRVDHATIAIDGEQASDVADFERAYKRSEVVLARDAIPALEKLASMYTGEFLPGVELEWADDIRVHLRGRVLNVFHRLANAVESSDSSRAAEWYDKAIATEPLDEAAHAGLMRIAAAAGNRVRVEEVYRRYSRRLRASLGLAASDALETLVRRIRLGAPVSQVQIDGESSFAEILHWLNRHEPERALDLLAASGDYWRATGRLPEIVQTTYAALEHTQGDSQQRATVLRLAGLCHMYRGEYESADARLAEAADAMRRLGMDSLHRLTLIDLGYCRREYLGDELARTTVEQAIGLCEAGGDEVALYRARVLLAGILWQQGNLSQARIQYEEVLPTLKSSADQENLAITLGNLAILAGQMGDANGCERYASEAQSHAQALGHVRTLWGVQYALGFLAILRGVPADAATHAREAVLMGYRVGNARMTLISLELLAAIQTVRGEHIQAAELLLTTAALRDRIHLAVSQAERRIIEPAQAQIEGALSPASIEGIRTAAQRRSLEDALALLPG